MARYILPLIALVASSLAGAQRPSRATLVQRLDSIASAPVTRGEVAGIAVAVVSGRDTLLMKGYGYADLENKLAVTPQTVFRIGSLTKQFTSAAVMQLVEQRKIRLDDDLTKYITFPTHGRQILIRHLLNHTLGIPSYTDIGPRFGAVSRLDLAPDSLIAIVAHDSLMFEPGSHMYYNNTGYFMLGMVLERATGRKYGEYLEGTLFKPAGLSQTVYCDARRIIPHRAFGYDRSAAGLVNTDFLSMQLPFAAGSLCSTVGDLVSRAQQLGSGRVVSAASFREMTTPVALPSGRPMTYGYGLTSDTVGGRRVISHGGGINGFTSYLLTLPQDSLVVAVLANTSPAPSSAIADAIMRAVLDIPAAPATATRQDLALSSADRARYAGNYLMTRPDGSRSGVRVHVEGEKLTVQRDGGAAVPMVHQGGHVFVGAGVGRFAFDVAGDRATGFVFGAGVRTLEGVRVK